MSPGQVFLWINSFLEPPKFLVQGTSLGTARNRKMSKPQVYPLGKAHTHLSISKYQPTCAQKKWAKCIFHCKLIKEKFKNVVAFELSLKQQAGFQEAERQWDNPVIYKISDSEGLRVKTSKAIWLECEVHARKTVGQREGLKVRPIEARQWRQSKQWGGKRGCRWRQLWQQDSHCNEQKEGPQLGRQWKGRYSHRNCQLPY